jgi:hypothetical protein
VKWSAGYRGSSLGTSSHIIEEESEIHPACYTMGTSEPEERWSQCGPWEGTLPFWNMRLWSYFVYYVISSFWDKWYKKYSLLITESGRILRKTVLFVYGMTGPSEPGTPHCRGFTITLRRITFGRTPLDEWSVRHRDLYLTKHNTHKRQTSIAPGGFEPAIPANEWPKTHVLDCAVSGIRPRATLYSINSGQHTKTCSL